MTQSAACARELIRALREMHGTEGKEGILVYPNLTARTIRVRYDGKPIFTGFYLAQISSGISVKVLSPSGEDWLTAAAPEVREQGLVAADQRSDIYSLCASLQVLFNSLEDPMAGRALAILSRGMAGQPGERATLDELDRAFTELLGEQIPVPPPPPARYWTEDQIIPFRGREYRIVSRLGAGEVGITYKVVERDRKTDKDLGVYVAKVVYERQRGEQVLRAYNQVRSILGRQPGLSGIYEVAAEWRENEFVSLMSWVEGALLSDYTGVFPLLAEELEEESPEALAIRWIRNLCEALETLHTQGFVHGDVSPRNIIVSGGGVVLTDYDFVTRIGESRKEPGTIQYCSPSYLTGSPAGAADDIYAMAASFFHVLFDRDPFMYDGHRDKDRGLNWSGIRREDYPILAPFLDRATHPDPAQRFPSVAEALTFLRAAGAQEDEQGSEKQAETSPVASGGGMAQTPGQPCREEEVEWLRHLLQSYPGSRYGNRRREAWTRTSRPGPMSRPALRR